MGEIHVRDDSDEDEHHSSRLLDGNVELRVDEDRSPMIVISEDAPFTSQDVVLGNEGPAPAKSQELELRWAVLAASTAVAAVTAGLTATSLLPSTGSSAAVVETLLHGFVLLAGSYGTFSLYADASYLSESEKTWSPSPWAYLVPGGVVVAAYLLWQLGGAAATALPVPALVGVALVAAALSAVPTGPVYIYNRHRTVGLLTE